MLDIILDSYLLDEMENFMMAKDMKSKNGAKATLLNWLKDSWWTMILLRNPVRGIDVLDFATRIWFNLPIGYKIGSQWTDSDMCIISGVLVVKNDRTNKVDVLEVKHSDLDTVIDSLRELKPNLRNVDNIQRYIADNLESIYYSIKYNEIKDSGKLAKV